MLHQFRSVAARFAEPTANIGNVVNVLCCNYGEVTLWTLLQGLYRSPCNPALGRYAVKQTDLAGYPAVL